MSKWFGAFQSVEDIKKEYRRLVMKYHPDHGGNEDQFKEIQDEFEKLLETFVWASFSGYEKETGKEASGNAFVFADILKKVIHFNIRIEIIGYWIYAFESFEYKDKLKTMGFWFSKKHRAWVYSGGKKGKFRTNFSLDEIKKNHGYQSIRDKEERIALPTI